LFKAQLESGTFCGRMTIRQFEGKYIVPRPGAKYGRPDYGDEAFIWEIVPSCYGGSCIRYIHNGAYMYWMTNIDDDKKLCFIPWGELWESFHFQFHDNKWCIYSVISKQYVAAQASSMETHLIADRNHTLEWEMFDVQIC
jgi:hypothetical protein